MATTLNMKRLALAVLLGASFACGQPPAKDKPEPGKTEPAKTEPAKTEPGKTEPTADCPPGDPLCDPRFKMQGKTFDIPKEQLKDFIYFKTPGQDAKGAAQGSGSTVIFPHKAHATERLKAVVEKCANFPDVAACTTCHHQDLEKDAPRKCSECHKEEAAGKAPKFEDALHTRCIGCHKSVNEKCTTVEPKFKVATECEQCHKAPATEKGASAAEGGAPATTPAPTPAPK